MLFPESVGPYIGDNSCDNILHHPRWKPLTMQVRFEQARITFPLPELFHNTHWAQGLPSTRIGLGGLASSMADNVKERDELCARPEPVWQTPGFARSHEGHSSRLVNWSKFCQNWWFLSNIISLLAFFTRLRLD